MYEYMFWNVCNSYAEMYRDLQLCYTYYPWVLISTMTTHSFSLVPEFGASKTNQVILSSIMQSFVHWAELFDGLLNGQCLMPQTYVDIPCLFFQFICQFYCLDWRWNFLLMVPFQVLDLGTETYDPISYHRALLVPHLSSPVVSCNPANWTTNAPRAEGPTCKVREWVSSSL